MIEDYKIIFLRLVLSVVFAGIIGLEREIHGRAAGLRTHILVSLGSCLIMLTSVHIFYAYKDLTLSDPARIAAGVVTGIGFLGAGTILRFRGSVVGLTTAASVWSVAAIGLAVGTGFYYGALMTTLIVIITLVVISKFEHSVIRKDWYRTIAIEADMHISQLARIKEVLSRFKVEIKDLEVEKIPEKKESLLRFDIKLTTNRYDDNIIMDLTKLEGISRARWE